MSSLQEWSCERIGVDLLDSRSRADVSHEGVTNAREFAHDHRPNDADDVEQRWDRLARQGRWMIAVYRSSAATKVDVVRINRAHHNESAVVRIQAEVGQIVHECECEKTAIDDRRLLDVPVDRILWYEIIDEIAYDDVPTFNAALAKGVLASRKIQEREPLTSADAAWRRPR